MAFNSVGSGESFVGSLARFQAPFEAPTMTDEDLIERQKKLTDVVTRLAGQQAHLYQRLQEVGQELEKRRAVLRSALGRVAALDSARTVTTSGAKRQPSSPPAPPGSPASPAEAPSVALAPSPKKPKHNHTCSGYRLDGRDSMGFLTTFFPLGSDLNYGGRSVTLLAYRLSKETRGGVAVDIRFKDTAITVETNKQSICCELLKERLYLLRNTNERAKAKSRYSLCRLKEFSQVGHRVTVKVEEVDPQGTPVSEPFLSSVGSLDRLLPVPLELEARQRLLAPLLKG